MSPYLQVEVKDGQHPPNLPQSSSELLLLKPAHLIPSQEPLPSKNEKEKTIYYYKLIKEMLYNARASVSDPHSLNADPDPDFLRMQIRIPI
jgi:hypothetical protein